MEYSYDSPPSPATPLSSHPFDSQYPDASPANLLDFTLSPSDPRLTGGAYARDDSFEEFDSPLRSGPHGSVRQLGDDLHNLSVDEFYEDEDEDGTAHAHAAHGRETARQQPRFSLFAPSVLHPETPERPISDEQRAESPQEGQGEMHPEDIEPTEETDHRGHLGRAEAREEQLQAALAGLRGINDVFGGYVGALEAAKTHNQRFTLQVSHTNALLDKYIEILGQTEHTQRLVLDETWHGGTEDTNLQALATQVAALAAEAAAARAEQNAREELRQQEEAREREQAAREAVAAAAAGTGRGRGGASVRARGGTRGTLAAGAARGRGRGVVPTPRLPTKPTTGLRKPATGSSIPTAASTGLYKGVVRSLVMPPKFDPSSPETATVLSLFASLGLTDKQSVDIARNAKLSASLKSVIEEGNIVPSKDWDARRGPLIAHLAGIKPGKWDNAANGTGRKYVTAAIVDGRLLSIDQVNAATKYLEGHPDAEINTDMFDRECGVGIIVTPEFTRSAVAAYIDSNIESISRKNWAEAGPTFGKAKALPELRWASSTDIKTAVDDEFTARFGCKEAAKKALEAERAAVAAAGSKKSAKASTSQATTTPSPDVNMFTVGFLRDLHAPGGNPQIKPSLRDEHLAATGGKVRTRFPPEPNGFLHIGHSKAIAVNFGYAAHHGGECILRFDDTNPEAEEQVYFDSILETVRWLGYEPSRVTYSSDYFGELWDCAVELIKRGKAYVCHCTAEEIKEDRGGEARGPRRPSRYRDRPIAENLHEFNRMRAGEYQPGEAILRMKQDLEDGNPQMWDLIAYRAVKKPHHRTGSDWCVYPTYDFTHCLVDSFENISHSLCTTEFILSRVSYEWLCDAIEVYKPRQSEYGRLNLDGTIMSKRKIRKLVEDGHVLGWDDPRLYTLIALRRRGIPPDAIKSFVNGLGVTTQLTHIEISRFENTVRSHLENTVPRLMLVLKPLKVTIANVADDYLVMVDKPVHPKIPSMGTSSIPFTRTVYIDASDFRVEDDKDYFRLAPGKTVGLLNAPFPITYLEHKTDPATGEVIEVVCRLEDGSTGPAKKPKTFIHWVADCPSLQSPVLVDEVRITEQLFKSAKPEESDFIADIAPDTLKIVKGAMVEIGFWKLAKGAMASAWESAHERTKAIAGKAAVSADTPGERRAPTPKSSAAQLVGNECIRFQGLRSAYWTLDKDAVVGCLAEGAMSDPDAKEGRREGDKIILGRIVTLKADVGKK
uniref:glutamine--tRNA ligase n=1 Tax=Bartheletia paradoxa TaxID=669517 RepID=A0A2D0XHV8_9BASI|nr:hypothetical protein SPAR05597 [Bartheletia paradoxa]